MARNKRKAARAHAAGTRLQAATAAETERQYRLQQRRKAVMLGTILLALAGITALTTFILVT